MLKITLSIWVRTRAVTEMPLMPAAKRQTLRKRRYSNRGGLALSGRLRHRSTIVTASWARVTATCHEKNALALEEIFHRMSTAPMPPAVVAAMRTILTRTCFWRLIKPPW